MRIPRDRLIFLGLAALDEVMRECATAPAKLSPALRVVLAMLFQLSNGKGRRGFVQFWRTCQLAPSETLTEYTANHVRTTELRWSNCKCVMLRRQFASRPHRTSTNLSLSFSSVSIRSHRGSSHAASARLVAFPHRSHSNA